MIGKNTVICVDNGSQKLKEIASFITPAFIHSIKSGFDSIFNAIPTIKTLKTPFINNSIPKALYHKCQIKNCKKSSLKIFHVKAFHKKISPNYAMASMKIHAKRIDGTRIVEFARYKKQISLCNKHHLAINKSQLFLEDLETNSKSFRLLNSKKRDIHF